MNRTPNRLIVMSVLGGLAWSASAWGHDDDKFKRMDANGDRMISAQEHAAGARMMFDRLDANRDGNLTVAEMDAKRNAMRKNDKGTPADQAMSGNCREHGMSSADKLKSMDSNGDGMVTAAEHAAAAQAMFTRMDTDQDGNVSEAEMKAARAAMMKDDSDADRSEDHAQKDK